MPSKYIDITATIQVIGCVFNNPNLLIDEDKYTLRDEDFSDEFHRIVYGSIYRLFEEGATKISLSNVTDYLSNRPKHLAVFNKNKGAEWLLKASDSAIETTFDYYYNRLKKFSLLRAYDNCGVDVSDIYDPDNIFDTTKKQKQEDFLDNSSLVQIADKIDAKIEEIRRSYVNDSYTDAEQAGKNIFDLIEKFKDHPEVGIPMYGPLINTITRGARLKKFYLRSAPTGVGNYGQI